MNRNATPSRRRFCSLLAGTGTATLAGCTTLSSLITTTHTNETTLTIGPETAGLTDAERERYVDRMAERYGSWPAAEIVPEAVDLQPGLEPATRVWDGERSLAVTDSSDATLAESDTYAAVYAGDEEYAADGNEYYVYWLWSCARPRNGGALRELWSHADVRSGDVLMYDPGGDVTDNGTIGPHPERTGQDTDEFAVRWRGDNADPQLVTGSVSERRVDGDRSLEWTVHLATDAA